MPFVDVVDAGRDTELCQRADASDAEQELLADPVLAVAAVERVRQPLHVEQVERDRTDVVAPDGGVHGLAGQLDLDVDGSRTRPSASGSSALYDSVWRPSAEMLW